MNSVMFLFEHNLFEQKNVSFYYAAVLFHYFQETLPLSLDLLRDWEYPFTVAF